ncbi:hypothetical protein [Haloglomus halophilum]|uniref:hypothetical protein n=1 Tax=Haloglomus halophilum TaxID=2962672 RepID=UPI0020CA18E9|nr:hypothetical protein [Haloglomus halophilum]
MYTTDSNGSSSLDSECDAPSAKINVCLRRETHARLTAYKNLNPFVVKTFDEAVTELLDTIEFPDPDEFESVFVPSMTPPNLDDE